MINKYTGGGGVKRIEVVYSIKRLFKDDIILCISTSQLIQLIHYLLSNG
jgi:hypothetical protein